MTTPGFQIASGFVEVRGEIDENQIRGAAARAGNESGGAFTRAYTRRIRKDRNLFTRAIMSAFTENRGLLMALRTGVPAVLGSPIGAAGLALGATFVASFVSGVISAGALGLLSGGILGLGAFALRENPKLVAAVEDLGNRVSSALAEAAQPLVPHFLGALETLAIGFEEKIAPLLGELFEALAPVSGQIALSLVEGLEGFLEPLSDPSVQEGLRLFVLEALPELARLGPIVGEFLAFFATHSEGVVEALSEIIDVIESLVGVFTVVIAAGTGFLIAWDKLWDNVGRILSRTQDIVAFWMRNVDDVIARTIQRVLKRVREWLSDIVEGFRGLPGRTVRALGDLSSTLFSKGRALIFGFARGIRDAAFSPIRAVRRLPGRLVRAVGNLGNRLWSEGRQLVFGFARGIRDAAFSPIQAAIDVANAVEFGLRAALGIGSPSKVFADRVGLPIAEGIALGINRGLPAVLAAAGGAVPARQAPPMMLAPRHSPAPIINVNAPRVPQLVETNVQIGNEVVRVVRQLLESHDQNAMERLANQGAS